MIRIFSANQVQGLRVNPQIYQHNMIIMEEKADDYDILV